MAQIPATYRYGGEHIPYTPGSAVLAGTIYVLGNIVTIVPKDIAADEAGATATRGVFNVPKDDSDVSAGDTLYWNATGDPVDGDAGTGAFTKTVGANTIAGTAIEAAGTSVGDVDMYLHSTDSALQASFGPVSVATVVVGGTAIGNANAVGIGFTLVTGADDTAAIKLPEAAAGKLCIVKNAEAAKILKVFPAVNDTINGGAANAVYNQGNGVFSIYVAYNAVAWFTAPETQNP
jgi:predicted RecA/RadA family phage recombinase